MAFVPLLPTRTPWRSRAQIAWFGPRGLSSLLLVLLAVFADIPGARELMAICSLVVLFSILVHGFSPMLLLKRPPAETPVAAAARTNPTAPPAEAEYITIEEYAAAADAGAPVTVADARTERTLDESDQRRRIAYAWILSTRSPMQELRGCRTTSFS